MTVAVESIVKITGTDHFQVIFSTHNVKYSSHDKVALIDGDGSEDFPNLALQKISAWEKRNGVRHVRLVKLKHQRRDFVMGLHPDSLADLEELESYDRIYASFIFTRSKPVIEILRQLLPSAVIGGTGADEYHEMRPGDMRAMPNIITQLPYEVENMYPDHTLYESETATDNVRFWRNPELYKYPKNHEGSVQQYFIKPADWREWKPASAYTKKEKDLIDLFNKHLREFGYEDGTTYRGSTRGNGYSSKGCTRKCTFCVVPVIQGNLIPQHYGLTGVINWILPRGFHPTMDEIVTLYRAGRLRMRPHIFFKMKKGKVSPDREIKRISAFLTISDNNFPADPTCLHKMDYMIMNNIAVNMNQGMDARLLTAKERISKEGVRSPSGDEICERLSKLHFINFTGTMRQMHFSWDFLSVGRIVVKGLTKLVEEHGLRYSNFAVYCLSGFNTTFEEDFQRVMTLKELGIDPYVMLFRNVDGSEGTKFDGEPQDWRMKHLARWTNNKILFKATPFEKYDNYVNDLKKRTEGNYSEEVDRLANIETFDWLTENYIHYA